ncbi:MAG: amino acid adenylation domain-containing protein [Cyclobacteriaceae bacterium]
MNDILLASFLLSMTKHYGLESVQIDLEGHGREDVVEGLDISRTVGWFTSIYPVILESSGDGLSGLIKGVKEHLRSVPNNGVDYLLLDLEGGSEGDLSSDSSILFNYLGQIDSDTRGKVFELARESIGNPTSKDELRPHDWYLSGIISDGQLSQTLEYSKRQYKKQTITSVMRYYEESLEELIGYCSDYAGRELTPSDLSYGGLTIDQLDTLQEEHSIEDVYPLSPMQEGMLFHSLLDESDHYFVQMGYCFAGKLDINSIERSLHTLTKRYDTLRTIFLYNDYERPLQLVLRENEIPCEFKDIRKEIQFKDKETVLQSYYIDDRKYKFQLSKEVPLRVKIYQTEQDEYEFIWSHHHILLDGWCLSTLMAEFRALYISNIKKTAIDLPNPPQYGKYIDWMERRNKELSIEFWRNYLEGYEKLSTLGSPEFNSGDKDKNQEDIQFKVQLSQIKSLIKISERLGVTLNTLIQTAWGILLCRHCNLEDVVFGAVVSGRPPEIEGIEKMIGLFINTIPVRIKYKEGDQLEKLVQDLQRDALKSKEHQFESTSNLQNIHSSSSQLFDHVLIFENYPDFEKNNLLDEIEEGEHAFDITNYTTFIENHYDLSFIIIPRDELHCCLRYNPGQYGRAQVESFADHFLKTIDQLIARLLIREEKLDREALHPTSYHQERLWFIDKFESNYLYKGSPVYHNIPLVIDFEGDLEIRHLEKSISFLLRKHEILRTSIVEIDQLPYQRITENVELELKIQKVTDEVDLNTLFLNEIDIPFKLDKVLCRAALLIDKINKAKLVISLHHAIADRFTVRALADELIKTYDLLKNGNPISLEPEVNGYLEFSRNQIEKEVNQKSLQFWKELLQTEITPLDFQTDYPRAPIHTYTTGLIEFSLDSELSKQTVKCAEKLKVDVGVVLMTTFKFLLHKYAGQEEIIIGTSLDKRANTESHVLLGPISNLVAVKTTVDLKASFSDYVHAVNKSLKSAEENRDLPFDHLVKELNLRKDMSRTAIFDILFNFEGSELILPNSGKLNANYEETNYGYGKYDLNLFMHSIRDNTHGKLHYNSDYFDENRMQTFVSHFLEVLRKVAIEPTVKLSDLDLLSKTEQRIVSDELNNTSASYPANQNMVSLFKDQCSRNPRNIALKLGEKTLTYEELDIRSEQISSFLRNRGVQKETIVGLYMNRSIELIVGLIGILKAGGAFMPIDTDNPSERTKFLLEDSEANYLLTSNTVTDPPHHANILFIEDAEKIDLEESELKVKIDPSDLCYIIYTSGTSGSPKGVMIEHRNAVRLFRNDSFQFDFTSLDVWTLFHSPVFDFSIWEIFGALLFGGRLVIVPKAIARDAASFLEVLKNDNVTVLNQTPSAFSNLLLQSHILNSPGLLKLRYVIFGGEALDMNVISDWKIKFPNTQIVNMYGITETTIHSTYKELTQSDINNNLCVIGKPLPTVSAYIFDKYQKFTPKGVKGELYIGGLGVARGYLNREALTNQRFIINPYNSKEKLYRSGDIVRLLDNGELEFFGRLDEQLQVRGFRIEAGEVESNLNAHSMVDESVVTAIRNSNYFELAAFYVSNLRLEPSELRKFLMEKLPEHMIPSYYIHLNEIPLTKNGKVDKNRLPDVDPTGGNDYKAPSGQVEEKLAEIWSTVLKLPKSNISVSDDFFAIGGDSLKAASVIGRTNKEFKVNIPLMELFKSPRIKDFKEVVEITLWSNSNSIDPESSEREAKESHIF